MGKPSDYLLFGIDASKKLLYSKWTTSVDSTILRAGLQQLAQIVRDEEIVLWIHESIRLHDMDVEDQKWATEVLAFLLTQTKLKYIAIIRSQKQVTKTIGASLRDKAYRIYGKSVLIEFFDSIEEAKAWIVPQLQHYKLPRLDTPVTIAS